MTVNEPGALHTLEGRTLEPDCKQDVALAVRTTLFVDY